MGRGSPCPRAPPCSSHNIGRPEGCRGTFRPVSTLHGPGLSAVATLWGDNGAVRPSIIGSRITTPTAVEELAKEALSRGSREVSGRYLPPLSFPMKAGSGEILKGQQVPALSYSLPVR